MRHMGIGAAAALGVVLITTSLVGQAPKTGGTKYSRPPDAIAKILETPPTPSVSIDPTKKHLLLVERVNMPPIADMARPMWRLAGLRIDPQRNTRAGTRRYIGLSLLAIEAGTTRKIDVPADADLGMPVWSEDGNYFAFTNRTGDSLHLWVGETATGKTRRLLTGLNGTTGAPFVWLDNFKEVPTLLCKRIPKTRGAAPRAAAAPAGPTVRETSGRRAPVRTYQDLLKNELDESRYEWAATSELVLIPAAGGEPKKIGGPGIYTRIGLASHLFIMTAKTVRPFSHLVTARSFPEIVDVWVGGPSGLSHLAKVASRPLRDQVPLGGVPTGPRSFQWHGGDLTWVEALDGGDPKRKAAKRDRLVAVKAPFDGEPRTIIETEHRFAGISWLSAPVANHAIVTEFDRKRRWVRAWLVDSTAKAEPKKIYDRSALDRYADLGRPMMKRRFGQALVHVHEGGIFLSGRGATPKGDRPFLRKMDLKTLEIKELWRCEGECYEEVVTLLSDDGNRVLTKYESLTEPPNYFVRDLEAGTRRALTKFKDPAPALRSIEKELVTYERADGVPLSATLYLPPGYKKGTRLPLVVWAYPREFTDRRTAGQVTGSPYRFTRIGGPSHLFFLLAGYAVMDRAAMPIIGDPETVNETFLEQIVAAGKAAIDKAAALGVADPARVGVGGHSYGAFMTANLLAHCDLFRAGIARSGAYNRTLTPFGFQSERRTLWQAPDLYFKVSPFMHADKLNEPILLVHGQIDNNSGTFPLQSERLYHALNGHGGTARLVMLPHESHGYRAAESVLHVLAEQLAWFDKYVKNAKPRQ